MPENKKNNEFVGKKIKPVGKKRKEVGADLDHTLEANIINASEDNSLNMSALDNFSSVAQSREQIYRLIDAMSQDPTIASILETYAEDMSETNDKGKIVWCESSDENISKYVNFLLESMNVDKHVYGWGHSLGEYGDLYLRLYRQSDYDKNNLENLKEKNDTLNEDIKLNLVQKADHYVSYLEAVPNPGEMFELTRFGKTQGFVQAPVLSQGSVLDYNQLAFNSVYTHYNMKKKDVQIYGATEFVHAALEDQTNRYPEEVSIFLNDDDYDNNKNAITYKVRRGQSILAPAFKVWRQLSLLENSVLLNRLTRSSIIRLFAVEVGDMPKENVVSHLQSIKSMLEQKAAINVGNGISEYTNPGPVVNNVYIPTHEGKGAISVQSVGEDVDPKQLTDLEYFQNKLFGSLRVPKAYFGITDDGAGFNGGQSLSIISSRYGKSVKKIQNAILQCLTDAINYILIDRNLDSYVNKFTLKMQVPLTQEELDRRDNIANKIRVVADTMGLLTDIEQPTIRLKILKSLMSDIIADPEVIASIQDQIDDLETNNAEETSELNADNLDQEPQEPMRDFGNFEDEVFGNEPISAEEEPVEQGAPSEEEGSTDEESYMPSPAELNLDFTEN